MENRILHGYRVSPLPHHAVVDAAALVLRAEHAAVTAVDEDTYVLQPTSEPCARANYKVLKRAAREATTADANAPRAVEHLRKQFRAEYYAGFLGKIRQLFCYLFGWFRFETASKYDSRLSALAERLKSLPPPPPFLPPRIPNPLAVFSSDYRDPSLIGSVPNYVCRDWNLMWMAPQEFLRRVDPEFTRHPDEDSIPWLLERMTDVAEGKSTKRFAPIMILPERVYPRPGRAPFLGHEGRHRALTAQLLNIPRIPVISPKGAWY